MSALREFRVRDRVKVFRRIGVSHVSQRIGMAQDKLKQKWENFIVAERSIVKRSVVALIMVMIGFALTYYLFEATGRYYFPSLTIVIIVLMGLYCGPVLAVSFAVILGLAADYRFIPPIGSVFSSRAGYEHFFIVVGLAIFVACLASSLRNAFRQTIQAKQKAERLSIIMEKVLALVSHDIRQPLNGIHMGAEFVLGTSAQTGKHKRMLEMILRSVQRADAMIESLLDVTSMRAGKTIKLDFQACDLSVEVGKMVEEISLTDRARLDYTADNSIWGNWGLSGIRRALENLVGNAIKYGAPNIPITIKLQRRNDQAVLSVHNQGPEIPIEYRENLFQAFQRTGESESSAIKGWGLGLTLVKGIAEAHGGIVTTESAENTGTTFTLELPIRRLERTALSAETV
jgi:signal transduction histidine kinase